jgi:hypothetical protein
MKENIANDLLLRKIVIHHHVPGGELRDETGRVFARYTPAKTRRFVQSGDHGAIKVHSSHINNLNTFSKMNNNEKCIAVSYHAYSPNIGSKGRRNYKKTYAFQYGDNHTVDKVYDYLLSDSIIQQELAIMHVKEMFKNEYKETLIRKYGIG